MISFDTFNRDATSGLLQDMRVVLSPLHDRVCQDSCHNKGILHTYKYFQRAQEPRQVSQWHDPNLRGYNFREHDICIESFGPHFDREYRRKRTDQAGWKRTSAIILYQQLNSDS
jgi:hypothetical protein